MSALLLAVFLLGDPPAATPASPNPVSPSPSPVPAAVPSPAPDAKRDKSLGAVAQRTTAGKKGAAPKVLTNDDLDKARQGGAAVSVLAADGVEPAPVSEDRFNSEDGTTNAVVQDEATWRQRADVARMRIADADANVTQAELRLAELRSDLTADDSMNPFREQNRAGEITAQMERLDAARAEAAAARQAMSDLEDEARRSSVPPGWLRER